LAWRFLFEQGSRARCFATSTVDSPQRKNRRGRYNPTELAGSLPTLAAARSEEKTRHEVPVLWSQQT